MSEFPQRLLRTRLYEQVAGQITAWIEANGLRAGDLLVETGAQQPLGELGHAGIVLTDGLLGYWLGH